MLFVFHGVGVDVLLDVGVAVLHHLQDAFFVAPLDEILRETRVLLSGAAQEDQAEVMLFASGPCAGGAVGNADAAANALRGVADYFAVHQRQGAYGAAFAVVDAGFAGDAAVFVVLRLCHADDAEVRHADFAAVVGTAGEGDLHVAVVGVDLILHLLGEGCGVIAAEGAQARAGAGDDISGPGGGIALAFFRLVDAQGVDDLLNFGVDLVHVLQGDAGDLDSLAVGDVDDTSPVLLGDLHDLGHGVRVDDAAGNADAGGCLAAHLGVTERVLL